MNLLCSICAFIIWKVSKSKTDVEMLDSGHEFCSRKLKSKPHPMFSFFEKKGKEMWCLLGNAVWLLLGKHATCWSGCALGVGAIWLKGKKKQPKYRAKINGRSQFKQSYGWWITWPGGLWDPWMPKYLFFIYLWGCGSPWK